jgi:hypothetical protein
MIKDEQVSTESDDGDLWWPPPSGWSIDIVAKETGLPVSDFIIMLLNECPDLQNLSAVGIEKTEENPTGIVITNSGMEVLLRGMIAPIASRFPEAGKSLLAVQRLMEINRKETLKSANEHISILKATVENQAIINLLKAESGIAKDGVNPSLGACSPDTETWRDAGNILDELFKDRDRTPFTPPRPRPTYPEKSGRGRLYFYVMAEGLTEDEEGDTEVKYGITSIPSKRLRVHVLAGFTERLFLHEGDESEVRKFEDFLRVHTCSEYTTLSKLRDALVRASEEIPPKTFPIPAL